MNPKRIEKIKEVFESTRLELINALKDINQAKSFRDMAKILGTDHAHLSRILSGKQDASLEKLLEYVDKLNENSSR